MKCRSFFAVAVEGHLFAKFLASILNFWRKFRQKLLGICATFQLGWDLPSPLHLSNFLSRPDKITLCAESCRQGWWHVEGKNVWPAIYHFIFLLIFPPLVRNCSSRVEWNRHHYCLGFEWHQSPWKTAHGSRPGVKGLWSSSLSCSFNFFGAVFFPYHLET